jgi:hypothetical protein
MGSDREPRTGMSGSSTCIQASHAGSRAGRGAGVSAMGAEREVDRVRTVPEHHAGAHGPDGHAPRRIPQARGRSRQAGTPNRLVVARQPEDRVQQDHRRGDGHRRRPCGRRRTLILVGPSQNSLLSPVWSPGGGRIVYEVFSGSRPESRLLTVRPDGSGIRIVARGPSENTDPSWSPGGRRIAFLRCSDTGTGLLKCSLHVMNRGGGHKVRVAPADTDDFAWAPNGTKLVYSWSKSPSAVSGESRLLWIAKRDGTQAHRLTRRTRTTQQFDIAPSWQAQPSG